MLIIILYGLIPETPNGPKGSKGDTAHFVNAIVVEEKKKSARHWCKIDSRSDLTYMKNIGVNV